MKIDKAKNRYVRLYGTYTNNLGQAGNPDTAANITIYPANSDTPTVVTVAMTNFTTGIYYYILDTLLLNPGSYSVRYTFTDAGVTQEYMQNFEIDDSAGIGTGTIARTIESADSNGDPVQGALVYFTADYAGINKVTANQYSDSRGITTWLMPVGTFYVWMYATGKSFSNPNPVSFA